jgi:hypothetical protein
LSLVTQPDGAEEGTWRPLRTRRSQLQGKVASGSLAVEAPVLTAFWPRKSLAGSGIRRGCRTSSIRDRIVAGDGRGSDLGGRQGGLRSPPELARGGGWRGGGAAVSVATVGNLPSTLAGDAETPLLAVTNFKWDTANCHRFILFSGSICVDCRKGRLLSTA